MPKSSSHVDHPPPGYPSVKLRIESNRSYSKIWLRYSQETDSEIAFMPKNLSYSRYELPKVIMLFPYPVLEIVQDCAS